MMIVRDVIEEYGPQGCISDEVRHALPDLAYSSVTARFRALIDKGLISVNGETRPGASGRQQRVMRVSWGRPVFEDQRLMPRKHNEIRNKALEDAAVLVESWEDTAVIAADIRKMKTV
jgi:hypothetical protein